MKSEQYRKECNDVKECTKLNHGDKEKRLKDHLWSETHTMINENIGDYYIPKLIYKDTSHETR